MIVDDNSIISCRENESERNNEVKTKLIADIERGIENSECRDVRGDIIE